MTDFNYKPPTPRPTPPPLPMLVLPDAMVKTRMKGIDDNILVRWLRTGINWDTIQRKRVDDVLRAYRVGHSQKNGMTIFWQIDNEGKVRTGKMMLYKPDGHRDKREGAYTFDWIHSALFRDKRHPEYDEDKQEMKQTLFGMHLLDHYKRKDIDQTVCIVESEKTALLMAIAYGNHTGQVWMACGGIGNINRDRLKPIILQHRNIILYPDRDGVKAWQERAEGLRYDRVTVDVKPVTEWWQPQDGDNADIADVVLRYIQNRRIYKSVGEVIQDMPIVKELHKHMNLKIET